MNTPRCILADRLIYESDIAILLKHLLDHNIKTDPVVYASNQRFLPELKQSTTEYLVHNTKLSAKPSRDD